MQQAVGPIIVSFALVSMVFTLAFGHLPLSYQVGIGLLIPLVALVGVWFAFAPPRKGKP